MDTSSKMIRQSHASPELNRFQLYFELVPVKKPEGRIKRSHASGK